MKKEKIFEIGSPAPAFELPDQDGKRIKLSEHRGKWVVLYFYPKDNTPGCTIEAINFTKSLVRLTDLNAVVLGVSADTPECHQKFIKKQKLKINLLSDPEHKMIENYGCWAPKKFMGREFLGILRKTFLINPKGEIVYIWPKVKVLGHAAEVEAKLKELQA